MLKLQSSLKATACMAAVALAAAGCSQDEFADQAAVKGNTTIVASFEGADTRTSVNDKNEVVWNKDDAFGLFYTTTQNTTTAAAQFTATSADGKSTTATFSGTLDTGVTTSYAVYPYQNDMKLDNGTVTMKLPATIDYTTASNGPMYAPASDISSNISFKHLAGLLKLSVSQGIAAEATKFVITASNNIAGTATANLSTTDPVLAITSNNTNNDASKTITVNLSFGTATTATTDFYIPIPAGSYSTLSAQLFDNSNKALSAVKEWSNITVTRAGMLTSAFGFVTIDATVNTNDGIKNAISAAVPTTPTTETTTEVKVASTINTSASNGISAIALPVNEKSNVGLSLEAVPTTSTEKPLVISDATDSNAETATSAEVSKNTVTVAIPAVTGGATAPILKITMPSSTVALDATGTAGTTYGTITAKTANNTLVVKSKVTVSKLIVAGGNVRVQNGGTITAIERASGFNDTPFLIKEEGATIPTSTTGFTVISAAEYDLMMAAKNGGTYVLSTDVTLTKPIVIKKDVVLDLNGHSIKPASDAALTIPEAGYTSQDALIIVNRKATLTINDATGQGSIDANGNTTVYAAVKMTDAIEKEGTDYAKLIVNGGTLKGYQAGISGNGTRHNTEITINGGTITSTNTATDTKLEATGIYHPQFGILNINGGTIKGYDSGIEMRAGKLTVSNGAIESTAAAFSEGKNGNGKTIVGAAVSVSQHTTNLELNATIKGGTLTGVYALYEKDLQDTNVTGISMSVTAGNLNGKVYSQNCKAFAKGGAFTDPAVLNYLAAGANVKVNMTADYTAANLYIPTGKTAVINLNKHKLTINSGGDENAFISGDLTLKNGSIENNKGGMALTASKAKLELDSITYTTTAAAHYGLFNNKNIEGSHLTVKNSTITSKYYALSTNALTNPVGSTTFTLENSHFIADETAMLVNIPAQVTITDCEFSGNHQAAFLRGGDYTITNSKFTLNATLASTHTENLHFTTWSSGNKATFAALTIGNYKSTAYQYYTKVAMTKVTATVTGTYASSFPAMHICANNATDLGVTLTYDTASSFTSSYSPAIEYGTTNITVNGKAVTQGSDNKFTVAQ